MRPGAHQDGDAALRFRFLNELDRLQCFKMIFIFAGVAVLQLTRNRVFRSLGPNGELPESARALAWAALICWFGAVTAGRLLAYI